MATSAGIPSRFATMRNVSPSDTTCSTSGMRSISKDHELAGVAPYSLVHRLRDSYGSVALLQTTLANEREERVLRFGLVSRLHAFIDHPRSSLILRDALFSIGHPPMIGRGLGPSLGDGRLQPWPGSLSVKYSAAAPPGVLGPIGSAYRGTQRAALRRAADRPRRKTRRFGRCSSGMLRQGEG